MAEGDGTQRAGEVGLTLAYQLYMAAISLDRARELRDDMDKQIDGMRGHLLLHMPMMREYLPPGVSTMRVFHHDFDIGYQLTIQRTGGQPRVSKAKLLELGVLPAIIEAATTYTTEGETVMVKRVMKA